MSATGATREILVELSQFVAGLGYEDLPERVREQAKLTFQHNLVVALAARQERLPGQDWDHWPAGLSPTQSATRLTDGRRAPTERAVVTNSLAMGARAQHDEHPGAISHFGSTVLPPLLAVAEQGRVDGAGILTAMVVGYEVGARIGSASVRATARQGFRPTGLYGPFAGAAAAGKAMGLDVDALVSALAFAANGSAGVTQTWLRGTDEWRYQTAFAARNGFVAADLAGQGVRGAADTLEGANGFFRAFGAPDVDAPAVLHRLGTDWALEHILLKPYPVCAFNQAPVQQVLRVKAEHRIDPADVTGVRVQMNPEDLTYPGVDVTGGVETRTAAIMCLRTCLALAILHDDVPIDRLEEPGAQAVRALADRIDLVADPSVATHCSSLSIDRNGGTTVDSGPAAGTVYDREVSEALIGRLQPLTGLDDSQMAELVEVLSTLETRPGLDDVLALVRRSAPTASPDP